MQLVRVSPQTVRVLSRHVDKMERLKLPLTEPQIRTLFEKAINQRELTPQEMFMLSKLLKEDERYGRHMANVCASLGARPISRLREFFTSLCITKEILEESAPRKSESARVMDFYQTIGVMVLEEPYCAEMVRHYLGPEKDELFRIINDLSYERKLDILDVGFGKGRYLIELSRRENLHVVGIDYSLLMQLLTRRIAQLNGIAVDARDGDATKMVFPDSSFDVTICMYNTLGNIPEDVRALGEMKRVTRKGGLVIISLLSEHALPFQLAIYHEMGLTVKETTDDRVYTHQGLVSKRHTKLALKNLMEKVGLDGEILEVGIGYVAVMKVT